LSATPPLPASWSYAPIEAVADINPRSFSPVPGADPLTVHFVPMTAVTEEFGGIDVSRQRPLGEVRKGYTSFTANDVLFAKITPCMENGKVALVPTLSNHIAYGSTEFHVLRAGDAVEPKWLAYFLSRTTFRELARQNMTGSAGQMRVPTNWLCATQLPVAPRAEQTRIIEKLEELLSDLDAGVAELKAAQKKLTLYRQSLLKAAVEGVLTAGWRARRAARGTPQETGADLLARILSERRARWEARQLAKFKEQGKTPQKGWQAKYPEPVRPDTEKLPMLPEGWAWASVAQLGEVTTGSTPSTNDAENFGDAIPFFKPGDLDAGYYVEQSRERLSEAGAAMGRVLPENSVLVTCIGATIGKTGFARVSCATNQQINALSVSEGGVIPEFVYWLMVSGAGQRQIIENASATTLPILNKSKFEKLVLPIAPLPEQTEIVSVLETESERISTQETAIKQALRQATAQRKNLLKAAFAGQLVPQNPNDEPASTLLARIRAEREVHNHGRPTRRTRKTSHA
jgi:type I restriction enzyme S subunit